MQIRHSNPEGVQRYDERGGMVKTQKIKLIICVIVFDDYLPCKY